MSAERRRAPSLRRSSKGARRAIQRPICLRLARDEDTEVRRNLAASLGVGTEAQAKVRATLGEDPSYKVRSTLEQGCATGRGLNSAPPGGGIKAALAVWMRHYRGVLGCAEVNAAVHSETCAVPAERLIAEREVLTVLPSTRLGPELAELNMLAAALGTEALVAALERAVAFSRWKAADVRSILAAGAGTPTPRLVGDALVIELPVAAPRSLAEYAPAALASNPTGTTRNPARPDAIVDTDQVVS